MKVGVLGSGGVAQALGTGFAGAKHQVMLGTREPGAAKVKDWIKRTGGSAGSPADAARFGELIALATSWDGTENSLRLAGPDNLAGKVLIDVTNPLVFHGTAMPTLALGWNDSAGEQVQRWAPKARVVKAFNIVTAGQMVHPTIPGGPPDMFICGNDPAAKQVVTGICKEFGWPTIDLGGIELARYIEPLAMVVITIGFQTGKWNHALKLLRER